MAMKVDIRADVSQLKEAINQAQGDITQLKINGSSVSIGGKKVKAEVKEVKKEVKELNREIQKTSVTTQQATAQATRGLKAVGTQAKQAIGFVKGIAQSLITPWTLLIIAVEAAAKTFQYFWNNLTENIDKAVARGQSAIKSAQRQVKKTEQRTKAINELIKQLENLNKLQSLSNEQRAYGASIINRLNKEYGIFGITLDDVTGKYQGLYQVQMEIDALQRKAESRALRKQISGQRQVVNATIKDVLGGGIELGKSINGKDLATWAERIGGNALAQNADLLAKKWGGGNDLYAIRDVFQQMMDGLSDRSNAAELQKIIDEINELIDYYQQLGQVNSISREASDSAKRLADSFEEQRKAIKATREEAQKLNEQYQQSQKQDQFNALSSKEQVKVLQDEIKALEERNKAIDELQTSNQQKIDYTSFLAQDKRNTKDQNYARQQQLQSQIDARVSENNKLEKSIAQYTSDDALREQRSKEQRLKFLNQKIQNGEEYQGGKYRANDKVYAERDRIQAQLDRIKKKTQAVKEQINSNKQLNEEDQKEVDTLKNSIAEAEEEAKKYGDIAYSAEQEVADMELERAKNQNEINAKKKQQAQITKKIAEEERKAAEAAAQNNRLIQQQQMNAEGTLAGIAEKAEIELLKAQGKKAEADAKERESIVKSLTKQIEGQLGRPLGEKDQALRESIEAGADIQMALKGINTQKPSLQNDQVYSNELARMGGFSSSIVVDRMDINKEILNVNKQANNNLNTIANSVQKIYDNTTL